MSLFREDAGILSKIAHLVQEHTAARRRHQSLETLKAVGAAMPAPRSVSTALRNGPSFIAEIKYASPSQGAFVAASPLAPAEVARQYLEAGARALSILTEEDHFSGSTQKLQQVRKAHPAALILQKDFFIEDYQVHEARAIGADAILIIVALLGPEKSQQLLETARSLGLEALVEVHDHQELEIAHRIGATWIGVNNRDLKTLKIDLTTSQELAPQFKTDVVYVAESGIQTSQEVSELHELGFSAFLVGTSLMREGAPGAALSRLIRGLA